MAVPESSGVLIVVHRAVGKLTPGNTRPTHSTDCTDLDAAMRIGTELVEQGTWSEFYIKTIHRRRAVTRA